jgi:multidrug efflux pump subunit AcrB
LQKDFGMWIVRLALNRPYTFIVASILILLLGLSSIMTMPTDIFPTIDIPVITVVYDYRGLQAQEMEQRITTFSEFIMSTVNDVKSIDSQTVRGYAVLMIYFQPLMPRWRRWVQPHNRFAFAFRQE